MKNIFNFPVYSGGGSGRKWDGMSSSYQRAESSLPGACPYTLLGPSLIMCVIIYKAFLRGEVPANQAGPWLTSFPWPKNSSHHQSPAQKSPLIIT